MFRPRASHDLRLIETHLVITPRPAHLRWLHDSFDNSVAIATFDGTTSVLSFESTVTLEHFESTPCPIIRSKSRPARIRSAIPTRTSRISCARWLLTTRMRAWRNGRCGFSIASDSTDTMTMLRAMTRGIRDEIAYVRRLEKGVQTPDETLARAGGAVAGISRCS